MKPETGDQALDAILHAAHRVRTRIDAELRDDGLSLTRYKLMKALAADRRSMREVSDLLGVAARTVTDIIDGLEAGGLVVRVPHASDRRVTQLELTDVGRDRLVEARRRAEAVTATVMVGLDRTERATLVELLTRVAPPPGP